MISKLIKLPLLKRIIPSLSIRILKLLKKNRGYFKIDNFEMFLDFLDPIDREIILSQEFEKQEIKFLVEQIKINKIVDSISSIKGVFIFDVDPGEDTNRTVLTMVGDPDSILFYHHS